MLLILDIRLFSALLEVLERLVLVVARRLQLPDRLAQGHEQAFVEALQDTIEAACAAFTTARKADRLDITRRRTDQIRDQSR